MEVNGQSESTPVLVPGNSFGLFATQFSICRERQPPEPTIVRLDACGHDF